MYDTVIFDLDGTLADTSPDLLNALNYCIEPLGLASMMSSQIGHLVGHGSLAMIEKAFSLQNHPADKEKIDQCQSRFLDFYADNIAVETSLFDGAFNLLERLKAENFNLAICTNKQEHFAKQLAKELDVEQFFDKIIGGDSFDFRKPDGRHISQTAENAGGKASSAIMIGDTITDIDAAKNANVPVIAVDFGYSDVSIASLNPNHIISHFDEAFTIIKTG